jgi:GT2 family glycosyltransferase
MNLRAKILMKVYKLFPFSLRGDAVLESTNPGLDISCVINFYGRIDLLEVILNSLAAQNFSRERFEVVLIEDRGGTKEGKDIAGRFNDTLNVKYHTVSNNYGVMGYSRNLGLSKAKGRYILFLDDDTVILQNDFISILIHEFEKTGHDAIVPRGSASFCLLKGRYAFHDPHFPTNRCMAYRREVLRELGGFVSGIIGQEDVEFVIRFIASGRTFHQAEALEYFHPPLIVNKINKAAAVGFSFTKLKKRYPLILWLMLLFNGSRYLPFLLLPIKTKWRMQARFSLGFLIGIIYFIINKRTDYS